VASYVRDSSTKGGAIVEKKRQRQWDKKHLRTVSTKLSVENFRKFSRYCQQHNTTPYRLMKEFILAIESSAV